MMATPWHDTLSRAEPSRAEPASRLAPSTALRQRFHAGRAPWAPLWAPPHPPLPSQWVNHV